MHAIVVREHGGPEVLKLEEMPTPVPGAGQVVVRVHAVGVNPVDTYIRSGNYAKKPALPYTPGTDAGGIIEAVGPGVTAWAPGDRVYIFETAAGHHGAYASHALCNVSNVYRLPDNVSFAQGAAVGVPYATAYRAIFHRAQARPGETVLVHGATGGVGLACVQLAHHQGMKVIGTGGTEAGLQAVRESGADVVFNHRDEGYQARMLDATGGRGVDVIIEMATHINLDHDLGLLAHRGRVIVIGNRGRVEIDARQTMGRDAAILGMTLWNTPPEDLPVIHAALGAGLANGTLTPLVGHELALADAPRAHELVMQAGALGKIVLVP